MRVSGFTLPGLPSPGVSRPRHAAATRPMVGTVALVSVLTGVAVGGGTFLLAAGPSRPSAAEQARTDDVKAAYRATDESRKMFGLLSAAAVSSTDGLNSAAAAVPEIFDSVDTAKKGADQLIVGLDEASSLSSALNQVASVTTGLSAALNQVGSLQQLSAGARTGLTQLRKQLIANPVPGSKEAVTRIDGALADTRGLTALDSVDSLRGTLAGLNGSLQSASAKADQSLASARTAAVQLRDGLAKLAAARPGVTRAVTNMTTGVEQLKVALRAIDDQLKVAQGHLQPTVTGPTPAPDPGVARPLAWSLVAGGGGAIVTFLVITAAGARLERRRIAAGSSQVAAVVPAAAAPPRSVPVLTPTDVPAAAVTEPKAAAVTESEVPAVAEADGAAARAAAAVTSADAATATAAAPAGTEPAATETTDIPATPAKPKRARRNRLAQLPGHPSTETNPWLPVAITGTVN